MFNLAPLPRTVEAALRDVEHAKVQVRLSALGDLTRLASGPDRDRVVRKLVRVLADDASPEVRAQAAVVLADAKAQSAGDSLVRALDDPDEKVRQMVVMALGELGARRPEHLNAVRALLDSPSAALRFQALVALHHLGDERLEGVLKRKLDDRDPEVRFVAVRVAEERYVAQDKDCPRWLSKRLRRALRDEAAFVRLLAAIVLHRAHEETDAEVLAQAVNSRAGVREPEDEQVAIEIAGELRLEQARTGLQRRAFGWFGLSRDPFAWQARVALAKMEHPRAVASILADLDGWTWEARTLAAAAAGEARLVAARARLLAMVGDADRANQETVREALRQIDAA